MRKIYSLVLMTTMLLVGTTAWAATYSVGDGGDYSTFSAFWSAQGAGLSNADEVTLVSNTGLDVDPGTYDFNGATVICQNFRLKIYKNTGEYTFQNAVVNCNQYAFLVNTASGIVVNLENVQITHAGTQAADDNKAAAFYISSTGTNATINIDANSSIVSTNADFGKSIWTVASITVNNSGQLSGGKYGIYTSAALTLVNDGLIQNCKYYGVYVRYTGTAVTDITNNGTISGKWYGVYSYVDNYNATITNHGLIKATSISNNGMGVYARKSNVDNYGTITCTSGKATYHGLQSAAAHITNEVGGVISAIYVPSGRYETGNVITNNGTITKGVYTKFYSNAAGTTTYPAEAYITNEGEITQTLGGEGKLFITNNGTLTISGGTYKEAVTFEGSNNTNITGGSFSAAPLGSMGYINPGDDAIKFAEGVGSLTIAPGYVWRNIDQMVCAISPVVEVTHANGSTATCLIEEAFANAADGDVITLLEDLTSYSSLWLGTEDMDGAYKSVTLDLNGHTLSSAKTVKRTITLSHGALYIVNSVPSQGGIVHLRSNAAEESSDIIYVTGSTLKTINPRTADVANLFCYLLIDEGVNISASGDFVNGVSLFEIGSENKVSQVNYKTDIYKNYLNWSGQANKQMGVANGVRIDIKGTIDVQKYGVKPNGNLRSPLEFLPEHAGDGIAENDTSYSAYIHIFPTAVVRTAADVESATAIYASGYARWLIEGTCQGATGVYAKSGVIDFNDAIIESTYTGEATITTGKGSGINAGGNAVVIESNSHYTGDQSLIVNGDTKISTEAEGGAAMVDVVDSVLTSTVNNITINGGSFTGDYSIVISEQSAESEETAITVGGVTLIGETEVGTETGQAAINTIIDPESVHTTTVDNPDGSKTVIISAGGAPAAATEWVNVAALPTGSDANWTGLTAGVIGDGTTPTTIKLGELQIISGSSTAGVQQLTVKDKAVLNVDRLIMNDYARIIVEAGGKLIVEGEQGINAPNVENITLRTSEDKQAIFLFHPNVTSNRHPNATVEFKTKSYVANSSNFVWERFGVPSYNRLEEMTYKTPQTFNSYVYIYDTSLDDWRQLGKIAKSGDASTLTTDELDKPFSAYNLICYNTVGGTEFVMKGALVGNVNADLPITETAKWATYSNSYSANVDIQTLISGLSAEMSATVWMYKVTGPNTYTWETVDDLEDHGFTVIPPMGAFILNKVQDGATSNAINYTDAVYNTSLSAAPVRRMNIADLTKAVITVTDENAAYDHAVVAASSMFTDEMDRGYDAEKYMNEAINLYVSNDNMSLAHFATDNLENTYLGFSCENGGTYTISFDKIQGEGLALIDLETNAYTLINAESMYQFSVGDNYANDYRFKIVSRQEMPTDVETIENVTINNNGIYTITGQYVGEMNIWNTLPKGIYIVNGEKLIK